MNWLFTITSGTSEDNQSKRLKISLRGFGKNSGMGLVIFTRPGRYYIMLEKVERGQVVLSPSLGAKQLLPPYSEMIIFLSFVEGAGNRAQP